MPPATMNPPIIITSQALACGAMIADSMMRSASEKQTPHLIVCEEPPPDPIKIVLEFRCEKLDPRFLKLKESAWQRANPNQPWYSKFQKRRRW